MAFFHTDIIHWLTPAANKFRALKGGWAIPIAIIFVLVGCLCRLLHWQLSWSHIQRPDLLVVSPAIRKRGKTCRSLSSYRPLLTRLTCPSLSRKDCPHPRRCRLGPRRRIWDCSSWNNPRTSLRHHLILASLAAQRRSQLGYLGIDGSCFIGRSRKFHVRSASLLRTVKRINDR
jgi:hypothetical protein